MSKLDLELNVLEGVTFHYVKIKTPSNKYLSESDREYSVDVHVDKATAKAWNKAFPKQKAKEVDYEVFVDKFGAENAIGDEEQYFIKLKKDAQFKDKETGETKPIPDRFRPRAFEADSEGNMTDITFTKLVGGGSKGAALFEVTTNSFGTFAKLVGIRVDEIVEVNSDGTDKFKALGNLAGGLANAPKEQPKQPEQVSGGTDSDDSNGSDDDQWT